MALQLDLGVTASKRALKYHRLQSHCNHCALERLLTLSKSLHRFMQTGEPNGFVEEMYS